MSRRNLPPPFVWIAGPGERAIRARKVAEAEEEQKKREEAASLAEFWCTIKAGKAGELGSLKWANALANEEKAKARRVAKAAVMEARRAEAEDASQRCVCKLRYDESSVQGTWKVCGPCRVWFCA